MFKIGDRVVFRGPVAHLPGEVIAIADEQMVIGEHRPQYVFGKQILREGPYVVKLDYGEIIGARFDDLSEGETLEGEINRA